MSADSRFSLLPMFNKERNTTGMNHKNDRTKPGLQKQVQNYYEELAPLLDLTLTGRGDGEFWRRTARKYSRRQVLELGCGFGRITRIFSGYASYIVGIDLSHVMLERAVKKYSSTPNIDYIQADIRRLKLARQFDLIVASDDPFAHLVHDTDRSQVLELVFSHLQQGGRFYLDALWFSNEKMKEARSSDGYKKKRNVETPEGEIRIEEDWQYRDELNCCTATYRYWLENQFLLKTSFKARIWSEKEIYRRFNEAGLKIRKYWGDYDCRRWDPDCSQRLIVVAARMK
jgi:SAM-dependent methyltransferase